MYTEDSVIELKNKVNLLEVVEEFTVMKKKGSSYLGCCPVHNEKTPSFHITKKDGKDMFKCFGCGASGDALEILKLKGFSYPDALRHLANKYNIQLVEEGSQNYVIPEWKNKTDLSASIVKFFEGRKISQKTLLKMKISEGLEYMPQREAEVNTMQFNYFKNDILVNIKYRDSKKGFKLHKGSELILYNIDSLKGKKEAILVEGEIDCLSLIEAGYDKDYAVLSVPNGASEHRNNLTYLNNCIKEIEHIEKWHLGFDNDSNGRKLREEIADRLGKDKCDYIEWKDKKDANDVLKEYGIQGVIDCCSNPIKFPLEGAFTISDFAYEIEDMRQNGMDKGVSIGLKDFPVRFVKGYMAIATGISAMGKSEFVDDVAMRLLTKHDWKVAYYSPENKPTQLHYSKLASRIVGKAWEGEGCMTKEEELQVRNYLEKRAWFIKPKQDFSLDSVLDSIRDLQIRHGLDMFVIDAWYNLEFDKEDTKTIALALNKIANFCTANNLLGFIVAHSVKPETDKKTGKLKVPQLFNISGSNNFHNKADYGFSVHIEDGIAYFHVLKRKFKHWGYLASPGYLYEPSSGRYYKDGFPDFTNWITGKSFKTQDPSEIVFVKDGDEEEGEPF